MHPRITMVTVVRDDRNGLLATLTSIFAQSSPPDEVLVVDGLSTDGSLELAKAFSNRGVHVSEGPDTGIYDAMNKGLRAATGDYLWFLNAGDTLISPTTISDVVHFLSERQVDWVYGAAIPVNAEDEQSGPILQGKCTIDTLRRGSVHVNHQAMLMSRSLLIRAGGFRLQFEYAAEYDLYLRAAAMTDPVAIPQALVHFRVGGVSYQHRAEHIREMSRARREHFQLTGVEAIIDLIRTNYLVWRTNLPLARIPIVRGLRNTYLEQRHGRLPTT